METTANYQSYLSAMQNYQTPQGRKAYQAPFAKAFEEIYTKAQSQDINLKNAQEFLQNLSNSELTTLQKYSGLADPINANTLSAEGAYNLLMHDKEQYDFNGDGVAEVGKAKNLLPVPINMPSDVRDAYISALNSLEGKDRLMAMTLSIDVAHLNSTLNNTPYTPTKMDYEYLQPRVQNILHPIQGAFSSEEMKNTVTKFWDAFNSAYTGDKTQNSSQTQSDNSVAKFLNDLRTKGAAKFLADLNQEKIDKMVEEYKQKLIDEMGDSPDAMQKIEKLLTEFRKKLLEDMQNALDNNSNTLPINKNVLAQILLNQHERTDKKEPLTALLQA